MVLKLHKEDSSAESYYLFDLTELFENWFSIQREEFFLTFGKSDNKFMPKVSKSLCYEASIFQFCFNYV